MPDQLRVPLIQRADRRLDVRSGAAEVELESELCMRPEQHVLLAQGERVGAHEAQAVRPRAVAGDLPVLVGHLVLARVDRERQAQVVAIPLDAREMHPAVIFELAGIDGRQELRERPTGLLPVHPPHCTTESLPQWCTNSSQVNDVSKIGMSSDDGYQIHAKRWARSWKARRSTSSRPGSQLT